MKRPTEKQLPDRLEPLQQLPTTSYAVLGLLTEGEMSGYDLLKETQRGIRFFVWSPAKSQIYFELQRLLSRGYVTEREVEQKRRPDKRLYRITPEGEQALRDWLNRPEPELTISKLLLKLYFGRLTRPEALISHIEQFRLNSRQMLAHYEAVERKIADKEGAFFGYLTLLSGLAYERANIQWADEVLRRLETRLKSSEEGTA
jgi:DNA-binding PadR family transcriptional regulator